MKSLFIVLFLGLNLAAFTASAKSEGYFRAVEYFREDKRLYPRPARTALKAKNKFAKGKKPAAKKSAFAKNAKAKPSRKPASVAQSAKAVKKPQRKPKKLIVSF